MKTLIKPALLGALVTGLGATCLHAQIQYLDYNFNAGSGSTYANSGTFGGSGAFTLANGSTPGYSSNGAGVSGSSGDYALSNTIPSMGGTGGIARQQSMNLAPSMTSFTLSGWYNTAIADKTGGYLIGFTGSGLPQIYFNDSSPTDSIRIFGAGGPGGTIGGNTVTSPILSQTNAWVFFALAYDGTQALSSDRLKFYVGDKTTSATQLSLASEYGNGATSVPTTDVWLELAQRHGSNAFDGLMDDVSLIGATSGSAGAYSLAQVDALRLSAIPEPTTWAMLAVGLTSVMLLRRRRAC